MKKNIFLVIIGFSYFIQAQTLQEFPELKGEYLGQKPPGIIPEIFAQGIVSDSSWKEHCQMAISPKGDEIYWSATGPKYPPLDSTYGHNTEQIYFSKLKNGKWTKPAVVEFLKEHLMYRNGGPSFTPDGKRLYFYSLRPGGVGKKDVYYVERTANGWSSTFNAGKPLNSAVQDWTPQFTIDGTAYSMGNYVDDKNEKPLRYNYSEGKFSGRNHVIIHSDFKPYYSIYVSPGERYLLFAARKDGGYGGLDLYVSFKTDNGEWGYPINMGNKINTALTERFPVVSPDGKYMFFMRHTETMDMFWVSTAIIDELKKQSLSN